MSELVAFLEARLAEDEAVARAGLHTSDCTRLDNGDDDSWCVCDYGARVLREVTAKRTILAMHQPSDFTAGAYGIITAWAGCETCGTADEYPTRWPCSTLRALAAPFSDHPDFQEQWR